MEQLYSIPGKVPNPVNMPDYCYFRDRCEMCVKECAGAYPGMISLSDTHKVSCYRFLDEHRAEAEDPDRMPAAVREMMEAMRQLHEDSIAKNRDSAAQNADSEASLPEEGEV